MNKFEVVSEFQPKGDQPNAIKELKKGLEKDRILDNDDALLLKKFIEKIFFD